jgi:hypothetical protein
MYICMGNNRWSTSISSQLLTKFAISSTMEDLNTKLAVGFTDTRSEAVQTVGAGDKPDFI